MLLWVQYTHVAELICCLTELNSAHMLLERQPENTILLLGADITEMVADSEDMLIATSTVLLTS